MFVCGLGLAKFSPCPHASLQHLLLRLLLGFPQFLQLPYVSLSSEDDVCLHSCCYPVNGLLDPHFTSIGISPSSDLDPQFMCYHQSDGWNAQFCCAKILLLRSPGEVGGSLPKALSSSFSSPNRHFRVDHSVFRFDPWVMWARPNGKPILACLCQCGFCYD